MALFLMSLVEKLVRPKNEVGQHIPYSELDHRCWLTLKTTDDEEHGPVEINLFNELQPALAQKFVEYCEARPAKPWEFGGDTENPHFIGTRLSQISIDCGFLAAGAHIHMDTDGNEIGTVPTSLYSKINALDSIGNMATKAAIFKKLDVNRPGTVLMQRTAHESSLVGTRFIVIVNKQKDPVAPKEGLPGEYTDAIVVGRVEDESSLDCLGRIIDKYGTSSGTPASLITISGCGKC